MHYMGNYPGVGACLGHYDNASDTDLATDQPQVSQDSAIEEPQTSFGGDSTPRSPCK